MQKHIFFWFSCLFDDLSDVGNLISGSSAFSKTRMNIWRFMVHVLLKPGLENFEHYFTSVWEESNCVVVWAFLGIAFLWDWNEIIFFHYCGHCWVFHICWHIECRTFTASCFRIWNSSTEIPSPPLALFIMMLPKAHLTSHSRISGLGSDHTIVIFGSWRLFFLAQFFCVFLPPLLYMFCFCWIHTISVLYSSHLCMKVSLVIFNFPILLFPSISSHWSPRKAFLSLLAILLQSFLIQFWPCDRKYYLVAIWILLHTWKLPYWGSFQFCALAKYTIILWHLSNFHSVPNTKMLTVSFKADLFRVS